MKLSPTRKAPTPCARRRATSSPVAIPLSVTSRRPPSTAPGRPGPRRPFGRPVLHELEPGAQRVEFQSRSGLLTVDREGEDLVLDFPARPGTPAPHLLDRLELGLGVRPSEVFLGRDVLAILADEATVRRVQPDYGVLSQLPALGTIISAPGLAYDVVSRCFYPGDGMPEDPVTGSAHCMLIPYWAQRLGKSRLRACQASPRGGELACELRGDRVRMGGRAVKVIEGHFLLDA